MHSHNISISWIISHITLIFCTIHVTIHLSLKRDTSAANGFTDLHTYWRFYSRLNTLSMIFLILFAPNTTMASIVMTVKSRLMCLFECMCPHRRDIYLCIILRHSISVKRTRTFLECDEIHVLNSQGTCQKLIT